ncbi:peroxisomal membrane protein-domain-containing protein [Myxozyma melibiosi]|uniref:Peroxisomal membrane protein PEX16 n=1 Tax=Myxozyma melibiosi TaxID=54550 RepID=A0ABR1FFA4_9ASCO
MTDVDPAETPADSGAADHQQPAQHATTPPSSASEPRSPTPFSSSSSTSSKEDVEGVSEFSLADDAVPKKHVTLEDAQEEKEVVTEEKTGLESTDDVPVEGVADFKSGKLRTNVEDPRPDISETAGASDSDHKKAFGWLSSYETFMLKNANQIVSLESTLQHITYIVPGKFKDVELATETIYSALNILGLYHDTILLRAATSTSDRYQPSMHTRYTHHYTTQKGSKYKRLAYILTVLQKVQLLLEVLARKYGRNGGERAQHSTVLALESVKALLRIMLLRATGSRMLPNPVVPGRDFDSAILEEDEDENAKEMPTEEEAGEIEKFWTMPRTGRRLPVPKASSGRSQQSEKKGVGEDGVARYLIKRVLHPDDVAPGPRLMHRLSGDGQVKEILYLLRPLIYAILAYSAVRMRAGSSSHNSRKKELLEWAPWVVGVAIEWACKDGVIDSLAGEYGGIRNARAKLTGLEKEELKKRGNDMWWWALRGKFYESVTKPILDKVIQKTENVPILNLVGLYVGDYQYLLETYHFASSTL